MWRLMADTSAPATAELLPCRTKGMRLSVRARNWIRLSSTLPLLSKVTSSMGRAPSAVFTPPRALMRSIARRRLRVTASPALANGPDNPSIMPSRIGS
ncbi:hypothetical protein D3C86_1822290 [compost metagenome]